MTPLTYIYLESQKDQGEKMETGISSSTGKIKSTAEFLRLPATSFRKPIYLRVKVASKCH